MFIDLDCKKQKISDKEKPHYIGHRQRLKQKFLSNQDALADYEILELLLFQAIPRRDVKALAKKMLKLCGGFNQLLHADDVYLKTIGATDNILLSFKLLKRLLKLVLEERVVNKQVISSWDAIVNYLKVTVAYKTVEEFRLLMLNSVNVLLKDLLMTEGTINETAIYSREVVKMSLLYNANSIILVHNHPSFCSKPSDADIHATRHVISACRTMNIRVHDHVIVAGDNYFSFKQNNLI